jgi:hypothetical protein
MMIGREKERHTQRKVIEVTTYISHRTVDVFQTMMVMMMMVMMMRSVPTTIKYKIGTLFQPKKKKSL